MIIKSKLFNEWNRLGSYYKRQHPSPDNSKNLYSKGLNIDSINAKIWKKLGKVYYSKGDFSNAITSFKHSLKFNPENKIAWYTLGTLYKNNREHKKAIKAFKKAIEIDPKYTEAWNNLALLYNSKI